MFSAIPLRPTVIPIPCGILFVRLALEVVKQSHVTAWVAWVGI